MKHFALVTIIFIAAALFGCGRQTQITGDTFLREICQGGGAKNSYWSAEFVGINDGKAYLRYWSAIPGSSGNEKIHFTPIDQLPSEFLASNPLGSCDASAAASNSSFEPKPLRGSA
jgi:hypothetical protein